MAGRREIQAGKASVVVGVHDKLDKGLRRAQYKLRAFGASVGQLGTRMMAGGAAMLGPLAAAVKQFSGYGDDMAKASRRTGLTVEALQGLRFAAERSGSGVEDLEKGVRRMQRTIYDAGRGLSTATEALDDIGVSMEELDGLSPEEQFKLIADRLNGVEDASKKAAIAQQIFGRSGTMLLPMFEQGAEGLNRFIAEAERMGLILSAEDARAAEELTDRMGDLWMSVKMTAIQVGAALAPKLTELADRITETIGEVIKWVKANRELVAEKAMLIAKVAAWTVGIGAALVVVGQLSIGIAGLIGAVRGLFVAVTFLAAHPVIAGLAALAAAFAAIAWWAGRAHREAAAAAEQARRTTAANDRERAALLAKMDALRRLADKQKLSNDEMDRAEKIIGELEGRYGDLGIELDRTAGKLSGVADGLARANRLMREAAILDLESELYTVGKQMRQVQESIDDVWLSFGKLVVNKPFSRSEAFGWADMADGVAELTARQKEYLAVYMRLEALRSGDRGALTGDVPGAGAGAGADMPDGLGDEERQPDFDAKDMELWRRTRDARIKGIDDAYDRDLANMTARYQDERAEIERTFKDRVDRERLLARLAEEYHLERRRRYREHQRERQREEREAARRAEEHDAGRTESIERLELEAKYEGPELERELLELERERAVEAAAAAGGSVDLVNREYDLRMELLERRIAADGQASIARSTAGTFSAAMLRFMGGRGPMEEVAENTRAMADDTREVADAVRDGRLASPTFAP